MNHSDMPADESSAGTLNRRRFLAGTLGAGVLLAGCGRPGWSPVGTPATSTTAPAPSEIGLGSADAATPARRGDAVQVTERPTRNWRAGQFVMSVDTDQRLMALTFDDGPSPHNTDRILRTLDSFGVKATFYLIGVNVRAWPGIARRTADAGHELGNHSVFHTPYRAAPLARQIGDNQRIIRDATGVVCASHRAPGLTRGQSILDTCASYDLYEVHTHMATYDWLAPRHSAGRIWRDFVRYHRNGAFALYHDGGGRRPTTDAVANIIRSGLQFGYTFVTASELMNAGVPQPQFPTNRYPDSSVDPAIDRLIQSETSAPDADPMTSDLDTGGYVDRCNYDAEAELTAALDRASITYRERMRIVEALADLDAVKRAG